MFSNDFLMTFCCSLLQWKYQWIQILLYFSYSGYHSCRFTAQLENASKTETDIFFDRSNAFTVYIFRFYSPLSDLHMRKTMLYFKNTFKKNIFQSPDYSRSSLTWSFTIGWGHNIERIKSYSTFSRFPGFYRFFFLLTWFSVLQGLSINTLFQILQWVSMKFQVSVLWLAYSSIYSSLMLSVSEIHKVPNSNLKFYSVADYIQTL